MNKAAIMKQINRLEASHRMALRAMSHKTALDELEEMMSHNIFDSEAEKARREEWRRQWDEFIFNDQNADTYRDLKGSAASMFFWQWQERKGYITHEQLVKMAGHENTIARWFREMPGIDPAEWPTPFPEYPEYDGDDAWGGFYGT